MTAIADSPLKRTIFCKTPKMKEVIIVKKFGLLSLLVLGLAGCKQQAAAPEAVAAPAVTEVAAPVEVSTTPVAAAPVAPATESKK
jgi:hypothetical protein